MKIRTWAALAALALTPALARAQQPHPIEFGVDAGLTVTNGEETSTSVTLPISSLRVGFYVSEKLAVEPALAFNYVSNQFGTGSSATAFRPELGLVYDLSSVRTAPQFYVRPFVGLTSISFGGDDATDPPAIWNAGAGIGVKIPMKSVERFAWRLEALYDHRFEATKGLVTIHTENSFGLRVGLSFFTK
jgi:hypothetical protein